MAPIISGEAVVLFLLAMVGIILLIAAKQIKKIDHLLTLLGILLTAGLLILTLTNIQNQTELSKKQIELINKQLDSLSTINQSIDFRLINNAFLDEDLINFSSIDNKSISGRKIQVIIQVKNYGQLDTGRVNIYLQPKNYPEDFYMDPAVFENIKQNQQVETTVNLSFASCYPGRTCSPNEIFKGIHNFTFSIFCQFCPKNLQQSEVKICIFNRAKEYCDNFTN